MILLLFVGCAKGVYEPAIGYDGQGYAAPAPSARAEAMDYAKQAPRPAPVVMDVAPSTVNPAPTEGTPAEAAPAAARMIYYNGWAQLRVADPQATVDSLSSYVRGIDGFVESLSGTVLTVRVPVARFDEAFATVLGAGELVRKSITAEDVTDAYTAVDLRVRSLKAERERLVVLLAKAKAEAEKLALLRQIQGVTEQLDTLEAQARVLQRLASYSRITVQLEERPSLAWSGAPDGSAFAWIAALSPFGDTVDGTRLVLPVPEALVALDVKKRFAAESADGVRFWTDRLKNDPQGTAAFWIKAVQERVAADFVTAEVDTQGGWTRLRLTSRAEPAYTWWVLVRVDGSKLDLAQVYFPTKAQEDALGPKMTASFLGSV